MDLDDNTSSSVNEDDYSSYLGSDDDGYESFAEENDDDDQNKSNYTILTQEQIRQRQDKDISQVSSVLSVSRDEATVLLHHCKWTVASVYEVSDETRNSLGLLSTPLQNPNPKFSQFQNPSPNPKFSNTCSICFEKYPQAEFFASTCGHTFCRNCWGGYMKAAISDGPGCLSLRCPDPECSVAVGESMVKLLAAEEDKKRYGEYLVRSYVENSRLIKWCPAPGCDWAVEFDHGVPDVKCFCSNRFCWKCGEEGHRPVDCSTVEKWMIKTGIEGENTRWIINNCKPCPKCRRPIQKNDGCMHMTCTQGCGFEFCWVCLGPWSKHSQKTGGYYTCNIYQSQTLDDEDAKAYYNRNKKAEQALNRYVHYYERWLINHNSGTKAISDLREMKTVKIKRISDIYGLTETMIKVVVDAWDQIVECRRVLKWSYAYGYYNCREGSRMEKRKKGFFESAQGEAEYWLEKLHECAEREFEKLLYMNKVSDDTAAPEIGFVEYKNKLTAMTNVTRGYFEKLVKGLENE